MGKASLNSCLKHQKHRGRCRATDLIADIWHVVLVKLGNLVIVFIRQTRHVNFILVIFDFCAAATSASLGESSASELLLRITWYWKVSRFIVVD